MATAARGTSDRSTTAGTDAGSQPRSAWRSVALPSEHGGWSLTAEPIALGLIVSWSWPGLALGVAAMLAFVARTPLKVVLVDRRRNRWLDRTRLAAQIAAIEIAVVALLVIIAWWGADHRFWVPLAIAAPLIVVELWYDMRSRSRHLVPELAGTIGIGSIAAAIAMAGGATALVSAGLWCVVAARSTAAIPYVRCQISRLKSHPTPLWHSDLAQIVAVAAVLSGWALDAVPVAAAAAIGVVAFINLVAVRLAPRPALVIGIQQTVLGVGVITTTAIAVLVA